MGRYIERALQEINPCGIENKPQTYCIYVPNCRELGTKTKGFVCISKMAYQVAGFLIGGNGLEEGKKDLTECLKGCIGNKVVDPKEKEWKSTELTLEILGQTVASIYERGKEFYNRARTLGSMRNPVNFDCSVEDIATDLF